MKCMPISILMDVLDIGSVYDQLGTPIGLTVYNGKKTERFILMEPLKS